MARIRIATRTPKTGLRYQELEARTRVITLTHEDDSRFRELLGAIRDKLDPECPARPKGIEEELHAGGGTWEWHGLWGWYDGPAVTEHDEDDISGQEEEPDSEDCPVPKRKGRFQNLEF